MKNPQIKQTTVIGKKKQKIKKRSIFTVFVLLIGLTFALCSLFLPELLSEMGKTSFQSKDYKTSSELFKNAHLLRPENKDFPYFWALSLSRMQVGYNEQKELYEISQMDNYAKAQIYAIKVLDFFKDKVMSKVGSNYIEEAIHDDQVLRWNLAYLPLKYYVDQTVQVPPYYLELIQKSFLEWQSQTNGMVSFVPTNSKEDAQILFSFIDFNNSAPCQGQNCEYSVGNTVPISDNNQLKAMDVKINARNNLQKYFSPAEIYTVMIHEIGHALGIWGHSDVLSDIMYYSADQKYSMEGQKTISSRDLNTLKLLYSLAPDVTNIELSPTQKEYFWYAPVFLTGLGKGKDFNIEKSTTELIANPNDINSWLELAAKYSNDEQYEKSVSVLTQALQVVSDSETVAVIYYNMANSYLNLKKYPEALECASRAQQLNNDFDTRALIALIKSKNGQYVTAENEFIQLKAEQPQNIDVALNLTDLYIAKKNYFKARDTVKALISSNPDAINDPKLSAYRLYTIF